MSLTRISTDKAPAAIGPYSQGYIAGDLIFTSGQIALDPASGAVVGKTIEEQTEQVIQAILRNYPGVFAGFVYIEETYLSHETGLTPGQVYQILKVLSQNRIIDFIPRRNTPTVGYPIARLDTELISLPPMVYNEKALYFFIYPSNKSGI